MNIHHVSIMTARPDEELKFYQEIVGLEIQRQLVSPAGQKIVFVGDGKATNVEIIENPEVEQVVCKGCFVSFDTEDVEGLRAQLEAQGFKPSPIITPQPKAKFFLVEDPAGLSVQFVHED